MFIPLIRYFYPNLEVENISLPGQRSPVDVRLIASRSDRKGYLENYYDRQISINIMKVAIAALSANNIYRAISLSNPLQLVPAIALYATYEIFFQMPEKEIYVAIHKLNQNDSAGISREFWDARINKVLDSVLIGTATLMGYCLYKALRGRPLFHAVSFFAIGFIFGVLKKCQDTALNFQRGTIETIAINTIHSGANLGLTGYVAGNDKKVCIWEGETVLNQLAIHAVALDYLLGIGYQASDFDLARVCLYAKNSECFQRVIQLADSTERVKEVLNSSIKGLLESATDPCDMDCLRIRCQMAQMLLEKEGRKSNYNVPNRDGSINVAGQGVRRSFGGEEASQDYEEDLKAAARGILEELGVA